MATNRIDAWARLFTMMPLLCLQAFEFHGGYCETFLLMSNSRSAFTRANTSLPEAVAVTLVNDAKICYAWLQGCGIFLLFWYPNDCLDWLCLMNMRAIANACTGSRANFKASAGDVIHLGEVALSIPTASGIGIRKTFNFKDLTPVPSTICELTVSGSFPLPLSHQKHFSHCWMMLMFHYIPPIKQGNIGNILGRTGFPKSQTITFLWPVRYKESLCVLFYTSPLNCNYTYCDVSTFFFNFTGIRDLEIEVELNVAYRFSIVSNDSLNLNLLAVWISKYPVQRLAGTVDELPMIVGASSLIVVQWLCFWWEKPWRLNVDVSSIFVGPNSALATNIFSQTHLSPAYQLRVFLHHFSNFLYRFRWIFRID